MAAAGRLLHGGVDRNVSGAFDFFTAGVASMPFAKHAGPNDRNLKLYLRHSLSPGTSHDFRRLVSDLWF